MKLYLDEEKQRPEEFCLEFRERLREEVEKAFGNDKHIGTSKHRDELFEELEKLAPGAGNDRRLFEIAEYFGYTGYNSTCMDICMGIIENGKDAKVVKEAAKLREDLLTKHYITHGIIE